MKEFYHIDVAGVERDLPLCKLNDELQIAAFVIFGDVEMTVNSAKALLEKAPEHDIMITAESKGIPLVHEMARQAGVDFAAAGWAYRVPSIEKFMRENCDYYLTSVDELREIIG